jgi:hypothetical protein
MVTKKRGRLVRWHRRDLLGRVRWWPCRSSFLRWRLPQLLKGNGLESFTDDRGTKQVKDGWVETGRVMSQKNNRC